MRHLKAFFELRELFSLLPDQSLLAQSPGYCDDSVQTMRGPNCFAAYSSNGRPFLIWTGRLQAARWRPLWFNPRTGESQSAPEVPQAPYLEFRPPGRERRGNDWALLATAL